MLLGKYNGSDTHDSEQYFWSDSYFWDIFYPREDSDQKS